MKKTFVAVVILWTMVGASAAFSQVKMTKDQMMFYTSDWKGDRFPDGRPKVPDNLLEKAKGLSIEEVWAVLNTKGYKWQLAGASLKIMHPDKKLVGRAVTAQFMPMRPDLAKLANPDTGGPRISPHQRILIDNLQQGDVPVVDLFGKVEGGTVVGDNLATAIWNATHTGLVVDGAVRDVEGIFPINMPVYYRGVHPSAIDYQMVMLTGINVPVKIGDATVMPGDVVFGDRGGLYFIPPSLIKEILDKADVTHIHDEWTKLKLDAGKYKSSDIYPTPHDPALKKEYDEYLKAHLGK
jgi:4-hydroxy-4-methyl-2-oxoglutarate aldolase